MTPFDRLCITCCQSAIVSIAMSCTIMRYLTLYDIVTLKSRLGVIHRANLCTICTMRWNLQTWCYIFCCWQFVSVKFNFTQWDLEGSNIW